MKPAQLSKDLRRLAADINKIKEPSLSEVSSRLGGLIKAVEEDEDLTEGHQLIELSGPFKKGHSYTYNHWLTIEGVITNPEYLKLDPTAEGRTEHKIYIDINWYYEPADPSVGVYEDYEMEEFEVGSIGIPESYGAEIILLSEEDRKKITQQFSEQIKDSEDELFNQLKQINNPY